MSRVQVRPFEPHARDKSQLAAQINRVHHVSGRDLLYQVELRLMSSGGFEKFALFAE